MQIQENISLKPYNTFGINAQARYFVVVESVADVQELVQTDVFRDNERLFLGGGSNVLFASDYDGLVIISQVKGREVTERSDDAATIRVGAGENWHETVMWTLDQGLAGFENLALIPGSVGATPIQNIGAYGVEIKEFVTTVEAVEVATGEIKMLGNTDCQFAYRHSAFKGELLGQYIITHVNYRLGTDQSSPNTSYASLARELETRGIEHPTSQDVADAVIAVRQSKLPDWHDMPNAGSFFKNPIIPDAQFTNLQEQFPDVPHYEATPGHTKIPAAWLIDQCGWKGTRRGDAGVHEKHALVLINYGDATGAELWQLAQDIQASVEEKFGIELEPEVRVIGA